MRTPLGASIDYTNDRLQQAEAILQAHPEIVTEFAAIGFGNAGQVNQGFVVVRMAPREARTVSQQASIAMLRRRVRRDSWRADLCGALPDRRRAARRAAAVRAGGTGARRSRSARERTAAALRRGTGARQDGPRPAARSAADHAATGPDADRGCRTLDPGSRARPQHPDRRAGRGQVQRRAGRWPALRHPVEGSRRGVPDCRPISRRSISGTRRAIWCASTRSPR